MYSGKSYKINSSSLAEQLIRARRKSLRNPFHSITNVPDRMEQIRVVNGVSFVNDARAENVNATYFALESLKKPIVWIAGGDATGVDYWDLMALVRVKVSAIIMIGKDNARLHQTFSPVIDDIYEVKTMREAVQLAYEISEPGTNVLLSPATKADLLYADYQDRESQFINAVKQI